MWVSHGPHLYVRHGAFTTFMTPQDQHHRHQQQQQHAYINRDQLARLTLIPHHPTVAVDVLSGPSNVSYVITGGRGAEAAAEAADRPAVGPLMDLCNRSGGPSDQA